MQIEYSKEAIKHIKTLDKPTKQRIKLAIEKLPSGATPDEMEAIERANKSIEEEGTIPHDAIDWD